MKQPPLSLIVEIQQKFAARGIHGVVDGSAVLASLGLVEDVQDWDLLTDVAPEAVQEVLEALECRYERLGPAGVFRAAGLFGVSAEDHAIDIISRFTIESLEGLVHIPARAGDQWQGPVLARPQEWEMAYRLMGRTQRADLRRVAQVARD
ncbi:hypothetical protein [Nesterenkonia massiliensis]|uniref:hypothetical protein n=1 Tax=Nesterenkonia massiliensis TaxID=1232429 RepID=UPI00040D1336|nr:hypothetical protein [Nesterenkonia massiliensis]